jgi:hypothetical protein
MPYKNRADQAAASKRHYEANKAKVIARAKAGATQKGFVTEPSSMVTYLHILAWIVER